MKHKPAHAVPVASLFDAFAHSFARCSLHFELAVTLKVVLYYLNRTTARRHDDTHAAHDEPANQLIKFCRFCLTHQHNEVRSKPEGCLGRTTENRGSRERGFGHGTQRAAMPYVFLGRGGGLAVFELAVTSREGRGGMESWFNNPTALYQARAHWHIGTQTSTNTRTRTHTHTHTHIRIIAL